MAENEGGLGEHVAFEDLDGFTGTVVVFSKPDCPQCTATYRKLDALGVRYGVVDVTSDPEARQFVMSRGFLQAPVVAADDEMWSGYRPDMLVRLSDRAVGWQQGWDAREQVIDEKNPTPANPYARDQARIMRTLELNEQMERLTLDQQQGHDEATRRHTMGPTL